MRRAIGARGGGGVRVDESGDGRRRRRDRYASASDVLRRQNAPAPLTRPRLHHLPHREVGRELVDAQDVAAIERVDAVLLDPSNDRGALVRAPGRDDESGFGHQALGDWAHQRVGGVGVVEIAG